MRRAMHSILGFALLMAAGCQTYPPPYGQGYQGSFPAGSYAPPSGTYAPQGTITVPATPAVPNTQSSAPPTTSWSSPKSAPATTPQALPKSVPTYPDAGTVKP